MDVTVLKCYKVAESLLSFHEMEAPQIDHPLVPWELADLRRIPVTSFIGDYSTF